MKAVLLPNPRSNWSCDYPPYQSLQTMTLPTSAGVRSSCSEESVMPRTLSAVPDESRDQIVNVQASAPTPPNPLAASKPGDLIHVVTSTLNAFSSILKSPSYS